jgi:hypothetical protein
MDFPLDPGAVSTVLRKRGDADWCYRRSTWRAGPLYVPEFDDPRRPLALLEALDVIETHPEWEDFKTSRVELQAGWR